MKNLENIFDTLEGTVENIIFSNDETGFTVMEFDNAGDLITAVGVLPAISPGEEVRLTGKFINHANYGKQFKVELCERTLPATAGAIYKYLSSGAIKGIGARTARKIVDEFGDDTLEIIEKNPEKLTTISRITHKKAAQISEEYKQIFGIRSVILELSKYGIDAGVAIRVWKHWGSCAMTIISENPYELCCSAIGTSFDTADEIANKLEMSPNMPQRVRAGILHVLGHNLTNGHTCLPEHQLLPTAASMLGIESIQVEDALTFALEEQVLISDNLGGTNYIYIPEMYAAETFIAGRLGLLIGIQPPDISADENKREIDSLEKKLGINYAGLQRKAISMSLSSNIFILTGGPGTGKTTTLNGIISLMEEKGLKTALAAPTGRAAKRMQEVCGRESKTIHRLLEVDFKSPDMWGNTFKRNEKNPLRYDAIILDEVSMVDTLLFQSLLKACNLGCRLILVGDPDQLPSVGAGNILGDLIASDVIPSVHLSEIFRQARQSSIVTISHEIVQGDYPNLEKNESDFFFLNRTDYAATMKTTVELCKSRLPKAYGYSPLWDIQVICPSRVGPLGTSALNEHLQSALNPSSSDKYEHKHMGIIFREQDKVMQIKNNYDLLWESDNGEEGTGVFNGDIGVIEMIDRPSQAALIRFDDRVATYSFDMLNEIEHAYAITVHKSQGSEFSAVIMPLMSFHRKLYYRNILYTAVTRARDILIILGEPRTISQMIDNNRKVLRYTNLTRFLTESVLGK